MRVDASDTNSSKLSVVALAQIVPLSRVDVLVTDRGTTKEALRDIEAAGVRVIVAKTP